MSDELPEDMVVEEMKDSISSEEMYSSGATHLGKSGGDLWDLVGTLRICDGPQRLTLIKTHFPKDPRRQRLALEWFKILMERYPDHQKGEDTDFGGAGNHPPPSPYQPDSPYEPAPAAYEPPRSNPMGNSLHSEAISEEESYNKAAQALGVDKAKCRELIELVQMLETSGIPGALESVCSENFPRDHAKQEAFARLVNELSSGVTLSMSTLGAPPPAAAPPSPAPPPSPYEPPSDAPPSPYEPPSPAGEGFEDDDTASKLGVSESRLKELLNSARELVSAGMNDGVAVVAEENWRGDYEKQATFSFYCEDAGVKP